MKTRYPPLHYHSYLGLDSLLEVQKLRSEEFGKPAHEEMLFIIVHQVYELWFKQILHELSFVIKTFSSPPVKEKEMLSIVMRLKRVGEILRLMIDQFHVLETMAPLDFLEFREYLYPASGFQSFQFRLLEIHLGLRDSERLSYNNTPIQDHLPAHVKSRIEEARKSPSLFQVVEAWLERTPFLKTEDFDFWKHYEGAIRELFDSEVNELNLNPILSDVDRAKTLEIIESSRRAFGALTDENLYSELRKSGQWRMSFSGIHAALLIQLYRDHPVFHLPYQLLGALVELDYYLASWRSRHALVVQRMLGAKVGTGGSSGHEYLSQTVDRHRIFSDLTKLTTFFVPRSKLPDLPENLAKKLDFFGLA